MRIITLIFFLGFSVVSFTQDIHFTQLQNAPLSINPAATGLFKGWERLSINHKNQWVNSGAKFFTSSVSADASLFKRKTNQKPYMGFGLQLFRDVGGDSKFGTKQIQLNTSVIIPLAKSHTLATGLQIGLGQKSGDLTSLTFSNQFDGTRFNQNAASFESGPLVSSVYADFSTGILYNYHNSKLSVARDDQFDFKFGLSYFHVNRPSLNFRQGTAEKLYSKLAINLSLLKDFPGKRSGIEFNINQFVQGPHTESLVSFVYRYRLKASSIMTSISRDTYLKFGLSYRVKDAISPILYFEHNSYTFGMSYDITVSQFSQASYQGGLEFSFTYTNLDFALLKRTSRF